MLDFCDRDPEPLLVVGPFRVIFEQVFFSEASTSSTYMEAYERVEVWHEETFGKRKYSDYNSFRNVKTQRRKK